MTRLAALLLLCSPAYAANCAPRHVVLERLETMYSERLQAGWVGTYLGRANLYELYASKQTGTSTITRTSPTGETCIVAAGTDFYTVESVDGDPL